MVLIQLAVSLRQYRTKRGLSIEKRILHQKNGVVRFSDRLSGVSVFIREMERSVYRLDLAGSVPLLFPLGALCADVSSPCCGDRVWEYPALVECFERRVCYRRCALFALVGLLDSAVHCRPSSV